MTRSHCARYVRGTLILVAAMTTACSTESPLGPASPGAQAAAAHNIEREAVMPSSAVQEIARYAPTTEIELTVVGSALGIDTSVFGAAIVQVVRQTLEELTS